MKTTMKGILPILLLACAATWCRAQQPVELPGFVRSPYFDEQVKTFVYHPDVKVHINAPSAATFDAGKPTRVMLFALPNTNRTHWCIGKKQAEGDDFHYQLLHIGGQTRFIRRADKEHNFVTVYLEPNTLVWGKWRRNAEGRDLIIRQLVDSLYRMFEPYRPQIELNGHSGGGSFIFGFMEAGEEIPAYVKRISFIDSNYNWTDKKHGRKLEAWLEASPQNRLSVICYDDGNALLNGKSFISHKGGTYHRSELMLRWLKRRLNGAKWQKRKEGSVVEVRTANTQQAYFFFRKNPERKVYHAPLGELNGYIQSALSNTPYEGQGYVMMGARAYEPLIQSGVLPETVSTPAEEKP